MESNRSVCIIGAGFSGLCAAIKLQKAFPNYRLRIFDSNSDFGGTWLVNTYPGCDCDIPSHLYSFSFEPNPYWSSQYPSQPEILAYVTGIAAKHNLYEKARFKHRVERIEWLEETTKWKVTVTKMDMNSVTETLYFDFVLCGTGEYHLPKKPEIFSTFTGPTMHTAEWDDSIELSGKVVGVIGSGASAIQIIPKIVDKVEKLVSYQRSPAWIVGRNQFNIPPLVQKAFANVPGLRQLYRTAIYVQHEFQYPAFQVEGIISRIARPIATLLGNLSLWKVKDVKLREKLTPSYSFGCNRVCLSSDYYKALEKDNVEVIRESITQVTADSIVTENRKEKLDVLILATGFDVHEYFGPLTILGTDGENVLEKWKADAPSLYLNAVSNIMPNLAFLHGPGVDVGHNTGLFTIECQVNWLIQLFQEMDSKGSSAIRVKQIVEEEYMQSHREGLTKTIWNTKECLEYYGDTPGLLTIVYPKTQIEYWLSTRKFISKNFEFTTIR